MTCQVCGREQVWHGSEHSPPPGSYLSEMGCHDGVRMDDDEHAEGWADDTIYPPCPHSPLCCKSCGGSGDRKGGDCPDCNGTGWKNGDPQWPIAEEPEQSASERLIMAAEAVKDDVCSLLCPSQWKTADGPPPHHPKCVELRAALSSQDRAAKT